MILAATAALAMLASCNKHTDEIADSATGSVVKITPDGQDARNPRLLRPDGRGRELGEEDRHAHAVRIRRQRGRRTANASSPLRRFRDRRRPFRTGRRTGQTYRFYAIANGSALRDRTLDDLRSQAESEIADYNGTFDEVTTKAKRSAGFTMTGSATQAIAAAGQTTTVQIALERLVSKVAVQATTDSKFAATYPGRVRIASATVSRAASSVSYFDVGTSHSGGTQNREHSGGTMPLFAAQTFSHTQAAKEQSGKYANLFYIYGNEDNMAAESVLLTLEGIYDHDGDFGTTDDQMPVSYESELAGDSGKGYQPQYLPPRNGEHQRPDGCRRGRDDHPRRLGRAVQSGC